VSSLTILIILLSVFHVGVMALMLWIRIYRTKQERAIVVPVPATPCARCGQPSTHQEYDGLDPNEQRDPHTGRAWSADLTRYQPMCDAHVPAIST
jgi:hypothetical protein